MSFLGLFFLVALPLAAAPVALHLFDRRRQVVIEWGAMQFLREAAAERTNARRFKQWLLLLLRMAMIAALVLALARPLVPGNWFGAHRGTETILILDNSLSMSRQQNGDGSLLDAAVKKGGELVESAAAGDSVRLLLSSPYPEWMTAESVRLDDAVRQDLVQELESLKAGSGRSDLLAAVLTAVQSQRDPLLPDRRVVVLTDGQAGDWRFQDEAGWKRIEQLLASLPAPTRLEIIPLDADARADRNLAVAAVTADRTVVGRHQHVQFTAVVRNHGDAPVSASTARWRVGDDEHFEGSIPALDGGGASESTWTHAFPETGVYAVTCRLDAPEQLTADNEATAVVEVVDEIPFTLLEANPDAVELQRDAFVVQAALGRIDDAAAPGSAVFAPTLLDPGSLGVADLGASRAIVIPNLTSLDADQVERLQEFVRAGGGLWLALGPRTDIDAFNQLLFADGHGLAPLPVDRIADASSDDEAAPVTIVPHSGEHPALRELTDPQQLDLADVRIERQVRFAAADEREGVSVLLRDTRGSPLAVEKYFGKGRVIVQGLPLKLQWSDLARSQTFVVLVRNWLDYLTQPRATRHNLAPGDPIALQTAGGQSAEAVLTTPAGDAVTLTGEPIGDEVQFRTSRTSLPGLYRLEPGLAGDQIPYYVRRDPAESDLQPLTSSQRRELAAMVEAAQAPRSIEDQAAASQQPLWPLLLSVLILLLMLELFLSGQMARERFGAAPVAETTEIAGVSESSIPATVRRSSRAASRAPSAQPLRTAN